MSEKIDLKGKKIMWVEDDKFLSDLLAKKLSSTGASLAHASDGESALKEIEKENPDLILLDILLPGINGFDVLQKIKSDSKTKKIPVILLSNLSQQSDIEKGASLGAEKFIVKATVTLDEIAEAVVDTLRQ